VILGILALTKNGYSYSNNFSTVVRTTGHLHLDTAVLSEETTGADPLPSHLKKISLSLKGQVANGDGVYNPVDMGLRQSNFSSSMEKNQSQVEASMRHPGREIS